MKYTRIKEGRYIDRERITWETTKGRGRTNGRNHEINAEKEKQIILKEEREGKM
jgi:hypothetical protein